MKYERFFELAKSAGISEAQLYISKRYSLSFSLFHSEADNYSVSNAFKIIARGIVNGKFGSATCDVWNQEKAQYLVDEIVKNAKVIEIDDPSIIYPGSPKYKKINTFNKDLALVPIEKKMELLYQLEKEIKENDSRIIEIQNVEYSETSESITLLNSNGLKLTQKSNFFTYVGAALASDGVQTKSGYEIFLDNDFNKVNVSELAKKIAINTVEQLGGEPCISGKYKVVLSPDAVASLIGAYIDNADAESVQKHSSLFIDKLNEAVASRKVTIEDKPLQRSVFGRWFDDEGVATYNKPIIKNGKLMTYLYTLTTATKDGVTSTGNGSLGSKVYASPFFLAMKPGKKSQEELFKEVGDGIYITDLSGLHAGLNPQSGNFSLQSTGFVIEGGKKGKGLDLITLSGNLLTLFKDIVEVGSDVKVFASAVSCPSVIVKKLSVTGK